MAMNAFPRSASGPTLPPLQSSPLSSPTRQPPGISPTRRGVNAKLGHSAASWFIPKHYSEADLHDRDKRRHETWELHRQRFEIQCLREELDTARTREKDMLAREQEALELARSASESHRAEVAALLSALEAARAQSETKPAQAKEAIVEVLRHEELQCDKEVADTTSVELTRLQAALEASLHENQALERESQLAKKDAAACQAHATNLQSALDEARSHAREATERDKAILESHEIEVKKMQSALEEAHAQHRVEIESEKLVSESHQKEITRLQSALEANQVEISRLKESTEVKQQVAKVDQIKKLRSRNDVLETEINRLEAYASRLRSMLTIAGEQLEPALSKQLKARIDYVLNAVNMSSEQECAQACLSVPLSMQSQSQSDLNRVAEAVSKHLGRYGVLSTDVNVRVSKEDIAKLLINVKVHDKASVFTIVDELNNASTNTALNGSLKGVGAKMSEASTNVDWAVEWAISRVKAAIDLTFVDEATREPKYANLSVEELRSMIPAVVESYDEYTKIWKENYHQALERFPPKELDGSFRQDASDLIDVIKDAKLTQLHLKQAVADSAKMDKACEGYKWAIAELNDRTEIPMSDERRTWLSPEDHTHPKARFLDPGIKREGDVERKAKQICESIPPPYSKIKDVSRMSIVFEDAESLLESAQTIKRMFPDKLVWCKNKFAMPSPLGYRDINFGIKFPAGEGRMHSGEIQLQLAAIFHFKQKGKGHDLYEKIREIIQAFAVKDEDVDSLLSLILEEMGRTDGDSKRQLVEMIEDVKEDVRELEQLHNLFGNIVETAECKDRLNRLDEAKEEIKGQLDAHREAAKSHLRALGMEGDDMYGEGENVRYHKANTKTMGEDSGEDGKGADPFVVLKAKDRFRKGIKNPVMTVSAKDS